MISYHPDSASAPIGTPFTAGFRAVDVDDPERLAKCVSTYAWAPARFVDGYRKRENFIEANWLGLDFDSPEIGLKQIAKAVCDMVHILGTTRSHGVAKDGVTCDRFRLLLRAERPMSGGECLATLRRLAEKWPIDPSCIDLGRHFFACREIISVGEPDGYLQEVHRPPPPPTESELRRRSSRARMARLRFERSGSVPRWLRAFLETGKLCKKTGRNNTIYAAAIALRDFGFSTDEIITMIEKAPIDRTDLSEHAILATINSGLRRGV